MKKTVALYFLALFTLLITIAGCTGVPAPSSTPTTISSTTPISGPTLAIISPVNGAIFPSPKNVIIDVQVTNFKLVNEQGRANSPGEGHLHFYLDVDAPLEPDKVAIPANGSWGHIALTTYFFNIVFAGNHTISAQLVNNDCTPVVPIVIAKITIRITAGGLG